MAVITTGESLKEIFLACPRPAALLKRDGVLYLGPAVVQSPGAWTRVGPTWLIPDIGWATVGFGARLWGTTQGIAELAAAPTAKPTWHAEGLSISPRPHNVFACSISALKAKHMDRVKELHEQAEELETVGWDPKALDES